MVAETKAAKAAARAAAQDRCPCDLETLSLPPGQGRLEGAGRPGQDTRGLLDLPPRALGVTVGREHVPRRRR